jgi:hypothetical protein
MSFKMSKSEILSYQWPHRERVNVISKGYGNGPAQLTRVVGGSSGFPCKHLDYPKLLKDVTGYIPVKGGKIVDRRKIVNPPEVRKKNALAQQKRKMSNLLLSAGGYPMAFLTFTFAKEAACQDELRRSMDMLNRRYKAKYGTPLKALFTYERGGKTGRLHIHACVLGRFVHQNVWQDELWKKGIVHVQGVSTAGSSRSRSTIAGYITKYLQKEGSREGLSRCSYHVSKSWPDTVEVQSGYAEDPIKAVRDISAKYKAAGCYVSTKEFTLEDGSTIIVSDICVPKGVRYMPDIPYGVPMRFMQRKHLLAGNQKNNTTFFTDIEAKEHSRALYSMSARKLSYSGRFDPADYFQLEKEQN